MHEHMAGGLIGGGAIGRFTPETIDGQSDLRDATNLEEVVHQESRWKVVKEEILLGELMHN